MATSAIFSSLRRRRSPFPEVFLLPVDLSDVQLVRTLATMTRELVCRFSDRVFFLQRRNLRSLLRIFRTVLPLLESVRDMDYSSLPSTAIVCFKELYMVLYKSKMIFNHCSSSARVWLLLQSGCISAFFHELNLEISTLLDVLPLAELRIPYKAKEEIENLRRKSRRGSMVIGKKDELLIIKLHEFVDQLSHGVTPSTFNLRQFFIEGLRIRDSHECRLEIEFLEEQICNSGRGDSDPPQSLLCEVVALARYCRFLLFGIEEEEQQHRNNMNRVTIRRGLLAEEIAETFVTLPRDFCCPITLDVMCDPVITCTGQTYERGSIRRWIEEGNCTCPKTGQLLSHTTVVPNHALRNLISQWCAARGTYLDRVEDPQSSPSDAPSMAAVHANRATAALLVEKLRSSGTGATSVVREIRFLARTGKENRVYLAEAGAIPCLKKLLSSTHSSTQENSVTALLNLSIHEENRGRIMEEDGCLQAIVLVLKSGKTTHARENAAAALFSLSSGHEYKKRITEEAGVLQGLASLLEDGTLRGKRDALASLFNLCTHSENCPKVVDSMVVSAIVRALKVDGVSEVAAAALSLICRSPVGVGAVVREETALPELMEVMRRGSPRGKEHAVATLLEVFRIGGVSGSEVAARAPAMGGLLQSLLFTGTRRARRKAASLARVFRNCDDAGGNVNPQQT